MKTIALGLLASLLFVAVGPVLRANEVRIYAGTIKHDFFDYNAHQPQAQGLYVVHEPGTGKLAFIMYDRVAKTSFTQTFTAFPDGLTYPNSPAISGKSRVFISIDASNSFTPINFRRLRSLTKPVMTPISSTTSQLLAPSFAYYSQVWEETVALWEDTGTLTYRKAFTIERNDAGDDLSAAVNAVIDHLRALHLIN
jgi:hypothetical protein